MGAANVQDDRTNSIYVLLTNTGTLFTRVIKSFTRAPYNHASLVMDEKLEGVYSFGRKQATNPLNGGFVKEDVYNGTFRHFPETKCKLLRIAVTNQQKTSLEQIICEFEKNKDIYRYNLIGLIGVLIDTDLQPAHSYFCSQFVADSLRSSGIQLWNRPSTLVTPNDFLVHEQAETVFEGYLYDYPLIERHRLGEIAKRFNPEVLFG
ncbi:hypothetical protein FHS16_001714 [Paenibacillus endophyticus]|uniref:Permuted papain-like amidase YaeF/Yiix C92 family enzyme n=1 Tax=Paenibacillus endophyticus TaxID=1294268 RepID=A0A7W5C5R0_9BACL|nr:hypothetical protein [Paenibacillus endophyticus]MBB3151668.1 hypothetical protein [Paenibacillus endophyticus]